MSPRPQQPAMRFMGSPFDLDDFFTKSDSLMRPVSFSIALEDCLMFSGAYVPKLADKARVRIDGASCEPV
jgi:hypothetical protein